tara:strand:- start:544 stop:915 length:372 start_codon:yes stop_codon:yes gene_type:complete
MKYLKIIIFFIFYIIPFSSNAEDLKDNLVNKISKNIRCIVCQGQSVYDSQSDFAISLKVLITKKIEEGFTEDQIYDYLRDKYGEWIIYEPKFSKNTFFLWLLPILVFFLGGIIIFRKTKFFKL